MAERKLGWFKGFLQGLVSPRKPSGAAPDSPAEPVQAAALGSTSAGAAAAAPATPTPAPPPAAAALAENSPPAVEPQPLDSPAADTFLGEDPGALTEPSGAADPAATGLEVPGELAAEPAPPKPRKPRKAAPTPAVTVEGAAAKPVRKRAPAKPAPEPAEAAAAPKRTRTKSQPAASAASDSADVPKPPRKRAPKAPPSA